MNIMTYVYIVSFELQWDLANWNCRKLHPRRSHCFSPQLLYSLQVSRLCSASNSNNDNHHPLSSVSSLPKLHMIISELILFISCFGLILRCLLTQVQLTFLMSFCSSLWYVWSGILSYTVWIICTVTLLSWTKS